MHVCLPAYSGARADSKIFSFCRTETMCKHAFLRDCGSQDRHSIGCASCLTTAITNRTSPIGKNLPSSCKAATYSASFCDACAPVLEAVCGDSRRTGNVTGCESCIAHMQKTNATADSLIRYAGCNSTSKAQFCGYTPPTPRPPPTPAMPVPVRCQWSF
jgi:hypothetical protein